tara:strand:+ start:901 stop:1539 length:639 start_codon:yes stop_codon:yes gene_type:complete
MSSIKLIPTSGGGSVSLVPPNSTSGSDVTITLPTTSQTLPTTSVIEQFFYPCNGETVTTSAGDITLSNVTALQDGTTTYTDLTGSSITYTPPAGTKTVIYKFHFMCSKVGDGHQFGHFRFYIDSDEVTKAFLTYAAEDIEGMVAFEWPIRIGGTADTTTGRVASWSSGKTLKLKFRDYSSSGDSKAHETTTTDGTNDDTFVMPRIGITALTT